MNQKMVECPRCKGKGHVDWADIKRLKMSLKWAPGDCAYCESKGEVPESMISKVKTNETYLTEELSQEERHLLINNNFEAKQRAIEFNENANSFIVEIKSLHKIKKLNAKEITDMILETNKNKFDASEKEELLEYVGRIIKNA